MNTTVKKLTAAVLTTAMLLTFCSCEKKDDNLAEELLNTGNDFIEAVASEDIREAKNLVSGNSPFNEVDPDSMNHLIYQVISKASLDEPGNVRFNDDKTIATVRFKLTSLEYYTVRYELSDEYYYYMTEEDYLNIFNNENNLSTSNITLRFEKDGDSWLLKSDSAIRLLEKITKGWDYGIYTINITEEEAKGYCLDVLNDIAIGNLRTELYCIDDVNDLLPDLGIADSGSDPDVYEAKSEYVSAYVNYILNHDYEITRAYYYDYNMLFTGEAPSQDAIYDFLKNDFMVDFYAEWIKARYSGLSESEACNNILIAFYTRLAEEIKYMDPEPYENQFYFYFSEDGNFESMDLTNVINPYNGGTFYDAEHSLTPEETAELNRAAALKLYTNGDITLSEYNDYIASLEEEPQSEEVPAVEGEYPNQAVNTREYVPDFSDGSLVYADSQADANHYWMFYSKENGVLDTVEYYIDDTGIYVTCIFEEPFDKGTILIADWWQEGVAISENETITIAEDGTTRVTVHLPTRLFPADSYEFRLWDDTHNHVYAYVQLNKG